ncbi:MAG: hypothetical protein LQ346_007079 [Caloplaca aetnensis]|nr:MAG: hypothetical protein LQ346_007079 [Caloplaca aetnensis]
MAVKRKHEDVNTSAIDPQLPVKRAKKGFSVGPANLPDGTYRRKAKKIKDSLVRKAKIRKSYSKIKRKEPVVVPKYYSEAPPPDPANPPASMELHPARQAMLEQPEAKHRPIQVVPEDRPQDERIRKPKPVPFEKEVRFAQERREEDAKKRREAEESRAERQRKLEGRERFRKAMAKARTGGKNGQRKLGRESKVLLERVKNIVAN